MSEIRVPLSIPDVGQKEIKAVTAVLKRRWLTMGEETTAFESEFAEAVGVENAVAVSNCTVGLHLSLLALGVGPGDELLVPSLSFVATANAALYCGATPIFCDLSGLDDLNISADDIEKRITPATKGIVVVHYGGYPADMTRITEIAKEKNLFVVEDAAQAAGAACDGTACGAWGDAACFSFYSTKNATTGEGGMVTTNRKDVAERVRLLRSHAMTATVLERDRGERFGYDVIDLGFNYRIDELRAAMGRVQLAKLPAANARRREITDLYRAELSGIAGLGVPFRGAPGDSAHHLMPVLVPEGDDRRRVADAMRKRGIQTSVHYRPIHLMSYYRERFGSGEAMLPLTEEVAGRELTLPLYATMTDDQVGEVCDALLESVEW